MRRLFTAVFVLALPGCGADLSAPVASGPAVGIAPSAVALDAIGAREVLQATVLDSLGQPVPDPPIVWTSSDTSVVTVVGDGLAIAVANGDAIVSATSRGVVGEARVTVRQRAATLFKVSGDLQMGVAGALVSEPLVAQVNDRFGHSVEGVTVFFRVLNGGGTLDSVSPRTNALGRASTHWTLGAGVEQQEVAASLSVGAVTPAIYLATAK